MILEKKEVFSLKQAVGLFKELLINLRDTETKIRALLALTSIGGMIDKLLFANRDKQEVKQIKDFLNDFSKQIETIGIEKCDNEFFNSKEFHFLFKNILEKVRLEYKEEKIKLFRNFLLNCLKKDRPRIDFHYYLGKLDVLQLEHFEIIEWYYENKYTHGGFGSDYDSIKKMNLPSISENYISLENDLNALGFLSLVQVDANQNHRYFLSPIGEQLFEFIQHNELDLD